MEIENGEGNKGVLKRNRTGQKRRRSKRRWMSRKRRRRRRRKKGPGPGKSTKSRDLKEAGGNSPKGHQKSFNSIKMEMNTYIFKVKIKLSSCY